MLTLLFPHPVLLIRSQKKRTMVIADLHIGWEISLSKKGIHVPTQMPKLLRFLVSLISEYKPDELLILGDVKHTVATAEAGEWHDIPDFFNRIRTRVCEVSVLRGNHDGNLEPMLPENVKLLPTTGVTLGEVGFFHGHQWPSPRLLECKTLVIGHIHPVIAFRDPAGFRITRQVWVRADCDKKELTRVLLQKHKIKIEDNPEKTLLEHFKIRSKIEQLFIMPSFNDFLGGRPLNERRMIQKPGYEMTVGPVLRSEAVDMQNADTYLLDGTFLGSLKQLEDMG
jgi:putative SbcD/Mre11-related phosphoesterase